MIGHGGKTSEAATFSEVGKKRARLRDALLWIGNNNTSFALANGWGERNTRSRRIHLSYEGEKILQFEEVSAG